jgi:hypothetical protein
LASAKELFQEAGDDPELFKEMARAVKSKRPNLNWKNWKRR